MLLLLDIQHYGTLAAQVFFGLWLAPLGYLAYKSGLFPKALGVVLVAATVCYLVDLLAAFLAPDLARQIHPFVVIVPAIAEIWMVLYLLVVGVRTAKPDQRMTAADERSTQRSRPSSTLVDAEGWIVWLGRIVAGLAATARGRRDLRNRCQKPPTHEPIRLRVRWWMSAAIRLHINCTGEGSPTVVIDAGLGDWSTSWGLVQPEVAKTTRVCTYDRAGMGWSEPGPLPRDAHQIADELHTLLQNANIPGPYVMVGHSFGGLPVQVFVHDYPAEVAGVVLIESMYPGQKTYATQSQMFSVASVLHGSAS